MTTAIRLPFALAASALTFLLASCASTTQREALAPAGISASHRTSQPIRALVSGGSNLTAIGGSGISNDNFKQALETSLVQSGMFSAAGDGGYQLEAFIANIQQPIFGASLTVTLQVSYNLRRGGTSVWRKTIESTYEAPFSEAFVGVTRLRKATEGAARQNISNLIQELNARKP